MCIRDSIYSAYEDNISKVEIITGNSGQIKKEFPHWTENNHQIRYIENSWHKGSFIVKIEKKYWVLHLSSWQSYLGSIKCEEYYNDDVDGQRDILFSLIPLINSCPSSPQ